MSVQVFWASEDRGIATVTGQGVVTGVAGGRTQIAASKGGKSAVVPVTVSFLPPSLLRVSPTTANLFVGSTTVLSAEVLDAGGSRIIGQTVSWGSANPNVATVNSSGVVTGLATGTALVTATSAGLSASAVVSVQAVPVASVSVAPAIASIAIGGTVQFTATVKDAAGNTLNRTVNWSSSSTSRAPVVNGLVTGLNNGTFTISATSGGKSGSATVTVR